MSDEALPPQHERRRHPRYELLAQVRAKYGTVHYVLDLTNISKSGALLHLGSLRRPNWIEAGRETDIGIINPQTLDTVDLRGRIVRVEHEDEGCSFAVEFLEPDAQAAAGIEQLLRLGEPQQTNWPGRRPDRRATGRQPTAAPLAPPGVKPGQQLVPPRPDKRAGAAEEARGAAADRHGPPPLPESPEE